MKKCIKANQFYSSDKESVVKKNVWFENTIMDGKSYSETKKKRK